MTDQKPSLRQHFQQPGLVVAPGVYDRVSLRLADSFGYEAAGAASIQLEDQEFPKKCGRTTVRRPTWTDDRTARPRGRVRPGFFRQENHSRRR